MLNCFDTNQLYALIDNKALRKERQKQGLSVGSVITVEDAIKYNREGYAIYWTPNSMKKISSLTEHKDENVTHFDYFFVDIDFIDPETNSKYTEDKYNVLQEVKKNKIEELKNFLILPTMIVETRNGVQAYWKCNHILVTPKSIEDYKKVQKSLVDFFGGDDNAMNRSRFLRMPNYKHLKDPEHPFTIKLVYTNHVERSYTADNLLHAIEDRTENMRRAELHATDTPEVKEPPKVETPQVKKEQSYITSYSIDEAKDMVKPYLKDYIRDNYGIDVKPKCNFSCINPHHEDSTPSMEYFEDSYKVYCYGCCVSWDILDLIANEEGLDIKRDFITVLELACDYCGITLDKGKKQNKPAEVKSYTATKPTQTAQTPVKENTEAKTNYTEYFDSLPYATSETTPYLKDRGISDSLIKRYNIRFDSECDRFSGGPAVVFPRGCYSYNARTLRDDVADDNRYRRNRGGHAEIFNLEALEGNKPIVITEGEIDSLSVIEASQDRVNSIALGGVGYRNKLIKHLEDHNSLKIMYPLIIALDNDSAGIKGTQELAEKLNKMKIPYLVVSLQGTNFKDINEAFLKDRATLEANIDNSLKKCVSMLYKNDLEDRKDLKKELAPASDFLADFEQHIKDNATASTIPTGYWKLDETLAGGLRSSLYVIGAIPSLGKTTFCLQMADQIAKRGRDVIIFSLEQSRDELIAKSLSRETYMACGDERNAKTALGISTYSRYKLYSNDELELINNAKKSYSKYAKNIHIFESTEQLGTKEIREQIETILKYKRPLKPEGYYPVIIVDYLQILKPLNNRDSDKQNNDRNISELKRISRDYSLPVIAISSFNRDNYKNKVSMSAFKETGAIEYGCDVLMGLQLEGVGTSNYDEVEAKSSEIRKVELVILKNRNGALPKKPIRYNFHTLFNFFEEDRF